MPAIALGQTVDAAGCPPPSPTSSGEMAPTTLVPTEQQPLELPVELGQSLPEVTTPPCYPPELAPSRHPLAAPESHGPEWSSVAAMTQEGISQKALPQEELAVNAIAQGPPPQDSASDPELGTIRVLPTTVPQGAKEVPSELPSLAPGVPRPEQQLVQPSLSLDEVVKEGADAELGVIRVRPLPPSQQPANPQPPTLKPSPPGLSVPVFLSGGATLLKTDNTFATVEPLEDALWRSRLAVTVAPILGPQTFAYASVQSSWVNYQDLAEFSYRELSLSAGLRQRFGRQMIGDLGWTYQKLVFQSNGDRFLDDHSIFVGLTRQDLLLPPLNLTSFYRLQASFSEPDSSSRVRHTAGISLDYRFSRRWEVGLDTQVNWTQFMRNNREDFYVQAIARLSYQISSTLKLSLFSGLTRGSSTNQRIDFDNTLLGLSLDFNWRL